MRSNHNNGNGLCLKLSNNLQRYLSRQACNAIFILHTRDGLAHGDIKPDNIVVTDDYKLALIDLGYSENYLALVKGKTGTEDYRPKEVEANLPYRLAHADIYSLAVTLLVIMI